MYLLLAGHHLILLLSPPLTSSTHCICTKLRGLLFIDSIPIARRVAQIFEAQVLRGCQPVEHRVVASSDDALALMGPR